MVTNLSGGGYGAPSLVTMEGEFPDYDESAVAELLGIEEDDFELLGCGTLTGEDLEYLNNKYPEYMGIWPIIAKIGKAVVGAVPAIVKGIKKRRARKKQKSSSSQSSAKVQAMIQQLRQQAVLRKQLVAKKEKQKKLLMIGLPIAGIAVFMLMNRPRQRNGGYSSPDRGRYAIRG